MARTLDEAKAYAVEIGIEWTDGLEAILRRQGKISSPQSAIAPPNRDPRFASPDAIPTNKPIVRDPYANTVTGETSIDLDDPSSAGFNATRGFIKGASHLPFVGNIDIAEDEHPESRLAKYSELAGEMGGMATQLGSTGPVFKGIGAIGKGGGRLAQALTRGQQTGVQFGLYGTGVDAPIADQLKSGLHGYLMGNAFGILPSVPGIGRVMSHPVAGPLADTGIFTGIEKAGGGEDMTWGEALERGAVSAGALRLAHSWAGRPGAKTEAKQKPAFVQSPFKAEKTFKAEAPRLEKTPAEMEVAPTQRATELAELTQARNEPIPGSKNSGILSRNRDPKTGNYNVDGVVREMEAGNMDGVVPKERTKEIRKQVEAESEAGLLKKGVSKDSEVRRRELRDAYPEWTEFLDGGGGKLPAWKPGASGMVSPLRQFQSVGGGRAGYSNVADRLVTRVNQEYQDFTLNMHDQIETAGKAIMENAGVETGSPKAAELTKALSEGGPPPEWAAPLREQYEVLRDLVGRANEAMGGKGMGYVEGYAGPEFEAQPKSPIGKMKLSFEGGSRPMADVPIVNVEGGNVSELLNPSRRHRTGATENPEMDATRRLSKYNRDAALDVGHNMAIKYNNDLADLAALEGNSGLAQIIRNYSASTYKNQRFGVAGGLQRLNSSGPGAVITDAGTTLRQLLNKSVFINPMWNLTTQPSSSAMSPMNSGGLNAIKAPTLSMDRGFRKLVDGIVHQQKIKNRPHGGFKNTDISGSPLKSDTLVKPSEFEKTTSDAMWLGREVEKELGYLSAAARFYEAKELGLKGREILDHMSDGIHKDQSVYDQYTRSDILKSQGFSNVLPFKSFLFEFGENIAENFGGNVVKHGQYAKGEQLAEVRLKRGGADEIAIKEYLSGRNKVGLTPNQQRIMNSSIGLGLGIMVANSWSELIKGRPIYTPSSIPGYDETFGQGISGGTSMTANLTTNTVRGLSKVERGIEEENPALVVQGLSKGSRSLVPGGIGLIGRAIDTWANKSGADPYEVDGVLQTAHAVIGGPSATTAGREYYEDRSGRDSIGGRTIDFIEGPSIQRLLKLLGELGGGGDESSEGTYQGGR